MRQKSTYFLYTTSECGFCNRAKELLTKNKFKFVVMQLDREHPTLEALKQEMDWGTVPMVFQIDGRDHKFIGGYTDLLNLIEGNKNDQ